MCKPSVLIVWSVATLLGLFLIGGTWGALETAWNEIRVWSSEPPELGEVLEVSEEVGLRIRFGGAGGEICKADFGVTSLEDHTPGDRVRAYRRSDRPGKCLLEDAAEASRVLLASLVAMIVVMLLGLVLAAMVATRKLREVPVLTTRLDPALGSTECLRCARPMGEGYLPLLSGIHWRELGDPVGIPTVFGGLPGTVRWWGARPMAHAFRCESCEVVLFRYGKDGRTPDS